MHQFFIINKNGFPPSTIFLLVCKTSLSAALTPADGVGEFIFFNVMSEDQPSRAVVKRVRCIAPGAHVSGKFGDFIASTDGRRRKRARIFGHVIEASAANKYRVLFVNNITLECFSNSLHVESASSSVPPDFPPTSSTGSQ